MTVSRETNRSATVREPALLIGLIASILVAILTQIAGSGLVDGKGLVLVNDLVALVPVIAGLLIRQLVTPVAAPVLPTGTDVTTPAGDNATVVKASPHR